MKYCFVLIMALYNLSWCNAQITERLYDFGINESFMGVDQLPNGNILLAGQSGDGPNLMQARLTMSTASNRVIYSNVYGDLGMSRYTSVSSWNDTPIAAGGLVNDNLGSRTNFNAVTYQASGLPDVIFETAAFGGLDNIAWDIEVTNNGYFVAGGEIVFEGGGETFKTPYAMIAQVDQDNPDIITLESWSVPEHGLGAFIKVVVENDFSIFLLFEEEDDEGTIIGYKVFNYALPSGELLYRFSVVGMSTIHDFALGEDGSSFLFGGESSSEFAKILEVELDGNLIRSVELDHSGSSIKTLKIRNERIVCAGEIFIGNESLNPFIWQLDNELEETCYEEYSSAYESMSTVSDMTLTESSIIAVGSNLEDGIESSALWQMDYCIPNNVLNTADSRCEISYELGCFSISCLDSEMDYRIRLFDLTGRALAEGEPIGGSWCPNVNLNQVVTYQLFNQKNHQMVVAGKLKVID